MPEPAPAEIRVPSPQTPASPKPPSTTVETEQDLEAENVRKTLQKGYQSLAIIATFLSSVEAQIAAFTLNEDDKSSRAYQAFNSLFLVAIILSMFGAINATLSMRWYSSCWLTTAGFMVFITGLLTYIWLRQELAVAIITSIAAACGLFTMCLFYVPFEFEYVIRNLRFIRFRPRRLPASRRTRRRKDKQPRV